MLSRLLTIRSTDNGFVYVIKKLAVHFYQHNVPQAGGQLAYFFLLSLFPFLIFFNALIGSIQLKADVVIHFLDPLLPEQIVEFIGTYISYISSTQSGSVLSVGIVVVLFSASRTVRALGTAINNAYGISERKGFVTNIIQSMLFLLLACVLIVICIVFVTFSSDFLSDGIEQLDLAHSLIDFLLVLRWGALIITLFVVLSLLYYLLPNRKLRPVQVLPGTLFSLIGLLALVSGFSLYVNYFMRDSALYGSIGALVLLTLWLYIASIILILGAELNSILESAVRHFAMRKFEKRSQQMRSE